MLFEIIIIILLVFLIALVVTLLVQQRDRYRLAESNRDLADQIAGSVGIRAKWDIHMASSTNR